MIAVADGENFNVEEGKLSCRSLEFLCETSHHLKCWWSVLINPKLGCWGVFLGKVAVMEGLIKGPSLIE